MSNTSEADICNISLGRLGVTKTILHLWTEQSKEARNCRLFYPQCRDEVLERVPWPFAVKTEALALLPDANLLPGWSYQYAQPEDLLTLLEVVPEAQVTEAATYYTCTNDPWAIPRPPSQPFRKALSGDGLQTPVILANINDAFGVYVARVTNTQSYSALLVSLIADRLAMELAMPLTVDPRFLDVCQRRYNAGFIDATSRSFEQQGPDQTRLPPAIAARA